MSNINYKTARSKEWQSFDELWASLNKRMPYVVLRNFENLRNEIILSEHPDIDFLCRDRNEFLEVIHSVSRGKNINDPTHQSITICGKKVDIDIRCVGDGYLDTRWEEDILKTRELSEGGFYVPSPSHYYYSLLYHVLIQKKTIAYDYRVKLKKLGRSVHVLADDVMSIDILQNFMRDNGYLYTYPENSNTIANFNNVDKSLIKRDLVKYIKRKYVSFRKKIIKMIKQNGRKD